MTGKALNQGGIMGRTESTGLGVFYALREIMQDPELCVSFGIAPGLKSKNYIIQGFGNVGYYASHYMSEFGAKLIGVAEHDGSIYNPDGICPEELHTYMLEHKTILGFPGAKEQFEDESAIYKPCDIFIPAAMEQTISSENADRFQCKILAEAANGPTTLQGEEILVKKGIVMLPDVVLNSGGVTVSYFEWLKNLDHIEPGRMTRRWEENAKRGILKAIHLSTGLRSEILPGSEADYLLKGPSEKDLVFSALEDSMSDAVKQTVETMKEKNVSFRTAAYINAITKLHQHFQMTGITG